MENNLLYAKIFENGKIYIGITNNFKNVSTQVRCL